MPTPKNSLRLKKGAISLVLALLVSSLFGYVLPHISFGEIFGEPKEQAVNAALLVNHPLAGLTDAVKFCPNDNAEYHEIYLCGTDAERVLSTNIPNLKQIVWSKYQDGSCADECLKRSGSCGWDEVSTNTQYTVSEAGEYRILVTYNDDTLERFYFNVFINGLNPNAVVTNIDCGSPGNISINNIPASYEFSITNGASWQDSNLFTVTSAGLYDVLIRRKDNTAGCEFQVNDIQVSNNSINATTSIVPITCNTDKGEISIDIADASSSYIYNLSQGGSLLNSSGPITNASYTFDNLDAGTYDIEVTLASISSCSYTEQIDILPFQPIQPNIVVTKNIDCSPGIITVTETGGNAPYEFSTDAGVTYTAFTAGNQTVIEATTAGNYTVRIKDANGCEIDAIPVAVSAEQEIVYSLSSENVTCNGIDNGSITVDVTNTQGYSVTYSMDNGGTFQTSNVFSNLATGTYPIVIRKEKAGGTCDLVHGDVTINPSAPFEVAATVTQEIDCTNGSATLQASITTGGTAPFEYSINGIDFQPGQDFTGLGGGEYTITVKDANNCLATANQTINQANNATDLVFTNSGVDCTAGTTDITITVENGNAPFTYAITAPISVTAPDDTFTNLAPNTYTFEVTANDGCKIVRNYTVANPTQFAVSGQVKTNLSCIGNSDGSIEFTVTDYSTTFSYEIRNSGGTLVDSNTLLNTSIPVLTGLAADTYTITVTDDNGGCTKTASATVDSPSAALDITSIDVSPMNCGAPGSVTIEVIGGWGNYTYALRLPDNTTTTAQSNKTISGLNQPGTHTIILRDINGCVFDTQTFDLIDQGGPTAVVDATASNYCYSTATKGELKIDISAGEAPYFYSVNNGTPTAITGTSFTLTNLTPDNYEIKVIGNNGCETIVADTDISGQLFATAAITKPLGCGATPDATIEVTAEEGYPDPDYSYEVSINGGAFVAAAMPYMTGTAATFEFKVIDSKGCEAFTNSVTTIVSPPLTSSNNATATACGKAGTGAVELVAAGGTPPYQYSFDGSPFSAQTLYTDLDATSYNYSIRDALGCELTDVQVIIGAEDAITADITKTDITCDDGSGGGSSGTKWGNTNINNVQNATGNITIRLIRVRNEADYLATGWSRTYREYTNIDMSTRPSGYNIRMYWPHWFFVQIEDEKGCIFESDFYKIDQPVLPWIDKFKPLDQTCANGATFEFEVGDPTNLVGPFRVRLWPYDIESTTNGQYLPFDDASNPLYDPADPANERDYQFTGLLFGVDYSVVILDENTGCVRWRYLGRVNAPVDDTGFDVISTPQSVSCRSGANDGEVQFTIKGAGDNDLDGTQTVDWRIYRAGNPTQTVYQQNGTADDGGAGGDITVNLTGLRNTWYVVEVETESGCISGNRFLVHRPNSALKLTATQNTRANCNIGNQIDVNATGGWDNEAYYNRRNKLYQNWHPYEFAFELAGTDPNTLAASAWGAASSKTITPTAYDGTNNIYQVFVRDGSGCIASLGTPLTLELDPEPSIDTIDVTNRCTSTNELYTVVASVTDGKGATEYIWDGEVTTLSTKELGPGNHTLVVRDENGCTDTENIFIYPQMVSKANITQVELCNPTNSGEVTLDVYGGSGDYTFEQTSPAGPTNTTGIFTGLTHSITYEFEVTDNQSGCPLQTVQATLDTPVNPDFTARVEQHISCNGASDGIIVVEQNAAAQNTDVIYEYSLNGGTYQISNIFDGLPAATNYVVSIRSAKNCIQTLGALTITEPTALVLATPTVTPFMCTADNTLGMATVTASILDGGGLATGTAPYQYSYNGGSFSASDTFNLPFTTTTQTVTIDVIDANNCTDQIMVTVPAATKVSANIVETQSMNCDDDAIIEITGMGGSGNYEVKEMPAGTLINGTGSGTITIPANMPDNYVYQLTDTTTGCTDTVTYTIAPFDTIVVDNVVKVNDITCAFGTDGEFTFETSGFGASGFSYEVYHTNPTTALFRAAQNSTATGPVLVDNLPSGIFHVVVRDLETGCVKESDRVTIQSPIFELGFTERLTQELSCNPGNDGEITVYPSGGWGDYSLRLEDITNPSSIVILQDFDPNTVFEGLDAGRSYRVTLRDGRGCNDYFRTLQPVPPISPITVANNPTVVQPSCFGDTDASISVVASGGQGSAHYQYVLNNLTTGVNSVPQTGNSFSNLSEGEYTVTVTDDLGCSGITSPTVRITNPTEIEIDAVISNLPSCLNQGEITVNATGGSGTFEYRIISPAANATSWSTQTIYPLDAGTYEFIARDVPNGCISPISVIRTLQEVLPLEVTVDDANTIINCFGETDAVLVAEATGGLGGYQYQLEVNGTLVGSAQDSGIFENLGQGDYRILATSGVDCTDYSEIITISEPPVLMASLDSKEDVKCFGEEDGSVVITAQGGVAPFTYIISSEPLKPSDNNTFENLPVGTYAVFVQDANGCSIDVPFTIDGPAAAVTTEVVEVIHEVCSSDDNGSIEIRISGGTAPYEYSTVSPAGPYSAVTDPNSLLIDNLDGGTSYVVFIRDANECTPAQDIIEEINVGANLTANYETVYECTNGQPSNTTTITLSDAAISNEVMYALDSDDIAQAQDSAVFENLTAGTHFITIIHQGGCIERINDIEIEAASPVTLTSQPGSINEILVEATGGDGDYTYFFNDTSSTSPSFYINETGTYEVRVVDGSGCEDSILIPMEFIDIEIPNFFTPDGDGQNDVWRIKNSEGFPNIFVSMFDRYGRPMKQFIGAGEWDGKYKGVDMPAGDYWYIIKLNGPNDQREFVGHFTVYR